MKAAIYARVSTKDQDCAMQLTELREYCARMGWEIAEIQQPEGWNIHEFRAKLDKNKEPMSVCKACGFAAQNARHTGRFGEYVENMSSKSESRPELDRIKRDARARRFDVVVTWKLDRFGRSVQHLLHSIGELDASGVRFICITQGLDTDQRSPAGKLLMHIFAAFAEFERDIIVDRVTSGVAEAQRQGKHCGRPKRVFRRDQVRKLRQQGMSWRAIAAKLKLPFSTIRGAV
jgi:DNA invertase Pin-like site-specific DNA recombinase